MSFLILSFLDNPDQFRDGEGEAKDTWQKTHRHQHHNPTAFLTTETRAMLFFLPQSQSRPCEEEKCFASPTTETMFIAVIAVACVCVERHIAKEKF